MVRLALIATLVLSGCSGLMNAIMPSGPQHDDACACSITPSLEMTWRYDQSESTSLQFGNSMRDVYFSMEAYPHAESAPYSLAWELGLAGWTLPPEYLEAPQEGFAARPRPRSAPVYHTMGGYPAATVRVGDRVDGQEITRRFTVVRLPDRTLALQAWSSTPSWVRVEADVDSMFDSLTIDPGLEPTDWLGAPPELPRAPQDLLATRAAHPVVGAKGMGHPATEPPEGLGWERVKYTAEPGPMTMYRTVAPSDPERRRPAVVWLEGGFGGPAVMWLEQPVENDQSATVFVRPELAVFAPSFRGELDNPGTFEMFYGETADLLAAIEAVKQTPWVDPDRVYVIGHSTGGTHALLAAAAGADVRAVVSLGGRANLGAVAPEGYGVEPYDPADQAAFSVRSPLPWSDRVRVPVYYFEGDQSFGADAYTMARRVNAAGGHMEVHFTPWADHFSQLTPLKGLLVERILADTGPEMTWRFTEQELWSAMKATYGPRISLTTHPVEQVLPEE